MKILALEFSSSERSVAVAETSPGSERAGPPPLEAQRGIKILAAGLQKGQGPFQLIARLLAEAGVAREAIECLAIGLGPGSYTGIRTAIALAQGWQLARDISLLGVSSMEILAARAWREGKKGTVTLAIDAQRNEFYTAEFALDETGPRATTPLEIKPRVFLDDTLRLGNIVLGPDIELRLGRAQNLFPSARVLAGLASNKRDFVGGEALEPIYLRPALFVKAPPPGAEIQAELRRRNLL